MRNALRLFRHRPVIYCDAITDAACILAAIVAVTVTCGPDAVSPLPPAGDPAPGNHPDEDYNSGFSDGARSGYAVGVRDTRRADAMTDSYSAGYHAGYVDGKRHAEHTLIRDHGD